MKASDILGQSRASAIRIRQINDEIDLLKSRIGGQGTGFGTSIDHSIVLDTTRQVDELLEAEEKYAYELAICRQDVFNAECIMAGAEGAIRARCLSDGLDWSLAYKNAHDMAYALRLWYVEARTMDEMCELTGHKARVNREMLEWSVAVIDSIGIAHLKANVEFDDRTPEELRAEYGGADDR